ncbi:hypothetical protein CDD82_287 [Ophiocordyceps australis]|uniref:CRIB domain-containing protein n=1 Tax=Ophiocordyceps australis TaxID=1399860 RepID=A0A2C5ZQQ8_9HYPO|nr:hypothetical protein CDD82_287 [Ophiocordyceps australis]
MTLPSGYNHGAVPTTSVKKKKSLLSLSAATNRRHRSPPPQPILPHAPAHHLQDPASPPAGRSRSLGRHMKRAQRANGQQQQPHRVVPSESSSLASMTTSDGPASELGLIDSTSSSLARRSSNGSNPPSRGRPESLHVLGKNLFQRRAKSKPGHRSQYSSSTSSIDSTDAPSGLRSRPGTQFFIPSIFSWKKSDRDESAFKKRCISGPFNFQHIAHERREDHIDILGTPSSLTNAVSSSCSTPGSGQSSLHGDYDANISAIDVSPRGRMRHVRSHDNFYAKPLPTMPPCSDGHGSPSLSASSPGQSHPPRLSSRQAFQPEFGSEAYGRPQTGLGFRKPKPFNPFSGTAEKALWSGTQHSQASTCKETIMGNEPWPLVTSHTTLSDVPEEEEVLGLSGNKSILRSSQSAPMLRSMAQSQQRPTSGASETLGFLEKALMRHVGSLEVYGATQDDLIVPAGSWEDDVDYCYEHEAEADCNYQWDRPSLDTDRDDKTRPPPLCLATTSSPMSQHMPPLSPTSQTSIDISHEALTPRLDHTATNSFCLPHGKGKNVAHNGLAFSACDSQECHVAPLSAPMANTRRFERQVLAKDERLNETSQSLVGASHQHDPGYYTGDWSLSCYQRGSTPTTTTKQTSCSNSADKALTSAMSSRTKLTHRTASNTSLNKMTTMCHESTDSAAVTESRAGIVGSMSSQDIVPELLPLPLSLPRGKKGSHKPHASQSLVPDQAASRKAHDALVARRQRARTTSLSTQAPPPVGQYSLFPRAYAHSTGERI